MEALIRCGRLLVESAMFALKPDAPTPLVSQIVDGLRRLIADQSLKAGTKLPSIRAFAASHGVSVFTVVEAYDRLVAQGWLVSRANAGFFVKRRSDWSPIMRRRPSTIWLTSGIDASGCSVSMLDSVAPCRCFYVQGLRPVQYTGGPGRLYMARAAWRAYILATTTTKGAPPCNATRKRPMPN